MRCLIIVICFFLFICPVSKVWGSNQLPADDNPFLEMVGKSYAEYHDTYMRLTSACLHGDSLSRARLVNLFAEAAKTDGAGEWNIMRDMIENTVRFYESRNGGYVWKADYTAEDYSKKMQEIAERADKARFRHLKIAALFQAAEGYRVFEQNYERAFACYLEAAEELETINTKEFPPRPHIHNQLAGLYYTFKEYDDAIVYYQKIVDDPHVRDNYYNSYNPALNGMGLCYRYGYENYERSNSYFHQILQLTQSNETERLVWEGIAEGNIGYNHYLKGDLDTALQWLIPAVKKITRSEDFPFALQRATDIADIYLKKNDPTKAKMYIDLALDYYHRTGIPEKNSHMYEVLTRYSAAVGDRRATTAYFDSTLIAVQQEKETFSGLVLRRVEQQFRTADSRLHEQEMDIEQAKSRFYRRTTVIIGTVLVIIIALLGFILFYYNRTRNAYRKLVLQSQNWAGIVVPDENILAAKTPCPEESDWIIMETVEKVVEEKQLYKCAAMSLDFLASETGLNRYYISNALNRCSGKNFSTYMNEFRIKEAIRIMSDPANKKLTLDAIAFDAGFNDRHNFHRVFKKKTGLSPSDFRKNMNGN